MWDFADDWSLDVSQKGDHAVPLPETVSLRACVQLYSQKAPCFDLRRVPVLVMHSMVTLFWGYYLYLMHEKTGVQGGVLAWDHFATLS